MKALIAVTYARPTQGCRKTVTLNGGPFRNYTVGLHEVSSVSGLLRSIFEKCNALPSPPTGHPHQLCWELHAGAEPELDAVEEAASFELPSFEEMSAFMDAEMARMGMAPVTAEVAEPAPVLADPVGVDMTPCEIKAAIIQVGASQAAIARHLGVSTNSVSRVINGELRSARIEAELQKITGKPLYAASSSRGRHKTARGYVGAAA